MTQIYIQVKDKLRTWFNREEGATLVEYGLLVGLIACVCIAAITAVGLDISNLFSRIDNKISTVAT